MVFLAGAQAIKLRDSKDHVTITLSGVESDRQSQRDYDEVLDKQKAKEEAIADKK